jgi:hypothetical protein
MERRCGTRRELNAAIKVKVPNAGWISARIRDLSMSGLFLSIPAEHFPLRSVLTLELGVPRIASAAAAPFLVTAAMVVRTSADGVGLMFDEFGPAEIGELMAALDMPEQLTPWGAGVSSNAASEGFRLPLMAAISKENDDATKNMGPV